jgi:hypothetical protein
MAALQPKLAGAAGIDLIARNAGWSRNNGPSATLR